MKLKALFLIFFSFHFIALSQTPTHTAPTLQVGLDGLTFGKGSLDSELILEIIAEKQNEIKLRAAQNILLEPLNDCGATIYGFGDNVLRAVIEEKDPIIRKRKILESTVNTLFSIGFAEYYIQKIKLNHPNGDHYSNKIYNEIFGIKNIENDSTITKSLQRQAVKLPEIKKKYKIDNRGIIYYTTILDIAAEAIRKNPKLKELGIMNIPFSKTYEYQSNYLFFDRLKLTDLANSVNIDSIKKYSDAMYEEMAKELDDLVVLIGIADFVISERNFRANPKSLDYNPKTVTKISVESIINPLEKVIKKDLTKDQLTELFSILNYLNRISSLAPSSLTEAELSDIVFTFSNDFGPKLESLGISGSEIYDALKALRLTSNQMTDKVLANDKLNATFKDLLKPENLEFFTNLLSRLYEFDKGSTYIEYFNLISEISNFLEQSSDFNNPDVKEKLSYFNTFVKDYVVVSEDSSGREFIDFNVESFLGQLSDMPKNKPSRFNFLFDVGISTGFFVNRPFQLEDGQSIENLSFVAEKIGVKWKIYYPGFWKPRSPGETYRMRSANWVKTGVPKEPIVNNVFVSLYGSGLLYNIFDVSTENEFDSPFLGTALGIGFFNNLDVSVSAAVPVISNQPFKNSLEYPMLSINFDFRFNEYIQRLGEKRKAAQTQKALTKAGL